MTMLYLSGPMSGRVDNNYPLFHEVAAILREAGYTVVNPAETPAPEGETPDWQWWMRRAITAMMTADAVAVLPEWGTSRGARTEVDLARELDMAVATPGRWLIRADLPPKALSDAMRRLDAAAEMEAATDVYARRPDLLAALSASIERARAARKDQTR